MLPEGAELQVGLNEGILGNVFGIRVETGEVAEAGEQLVLVSTNKFPEGVLVACQRLLDELLVGGGLIGIRQHGGLPQGRRAVVVRDYLYYGDLRAAAVFEVPAGCMWVSTLGRAPLLRQSTNGPPAPHGPAKNSASRMIDSAPSGTDDPAAEEFCLMDAPGPTALTARGPIKSKHCRFKSRSRSVVQGLPAAAANITLTSPAKPPN